MADDLPAPAVDRPLTERQRRLCTEFLICGNLAAASVRAGYFDGPGARQSGFRTLQLPHVAAELARLQEERSERLHFTADEVLRELATLVRSNVTDYVINDQGQLELSADASPDAWKAVASVRRKTRTFTPKDGGDPYVEHDVEYKLWDKNQAIDKAMKHLGMLRDGATVNIVNVGPQVWQIGDRKIQF